MNSSWVGNIPKDVGGGRNRLAVTQELSESRDRRGRHAVPDTSHVNIPPQERIDCTRRKVISLELFRGKG